MAKGLRVCPQIPVTSSSSSRQSCRFFLHMAHQPGLKIGEAGKSRSFCVLSRNSRLGNQCDGSDDGMQGSSPGHSIPGRATASVTVAQCPTSKAPAKIVAGPSSHQQLVTFFRHNSRISVLLHVSLRPFQTAAPEAHRFEVISSRLHSFM